MKFFINHLAPWTCYFIGLKYNDSVYAKDKFMCEK